MTPPYLAPSPPSWMPAIAAGALCTGFTGILGQLLTGTSCCCCPLHVVPLGVLPAVWMLRRDPALTPGQGFAVSFIANGLGAIASAITELLLNADPQKRATMHADAQRYLEELSRNSKQPMTPDEMADRLAVIDGILPYLPVVYAAIFTVIAGMCGLFAVGMLRRRRVTVLPPPAPPPPPPTTPPPPVAGG